MDPPDLNELISTLERITALDREQCKQILITFNWNLEAAVRSVLDSDPQTPPTYTPPQPYQRHDTIMTNPTNTTTTTTTTTTTQYNNNNTQAAEAPGLISTVVRYPFSIAYGVVSSVLDIGYRFVGSLLPSLGGEEDIQQSSARRFIINYERNYGQSHPNFFDGTFKAAVEISNRELKLLIVYLHSEIHTDTPKFCSNTLNAPTAKLFLDEHFIVWGGSINQAGEAMQVNHMLSASAYPFIAVLAAMTSTTYYQILDRIVGNISPDELITRLTNVLEGHMTTIAITRADREERETNRRLREEQDKAYKESLALDQEKERKRKEEEKKKEEEKLAKEREELEKKMKEIQLKQDLEKKNEITYHLNRLMMVKVYVELGLLYPME